MKYISILRDSFETRIRCISILFLFVLLFNQPCESQNLVPNPSFEILDSCPVFVGQIDLANGWFSSGNSPDLYNACGVPQLNVPNNSLGNQNAVNGVGYSGIVAYTKTIPNGREFISVQLSSALSIGVKYFVSIFTSLADTASRDCITNNFGARLSTVQYSIQDPCPVNNFAHISTPVFVSDKNNWTAITGSFIADSNYQYINIGNFYDDQNTDTLNCNSESYYYIDQICVSDDSVLCQTYVSAQSSLTENTVILGSNIITDQISLKLLKAQSLISIELFDSKGILLYKNKILNYSSDFLLINLDNISNGILFLKLNIKNSIITFKILKL